MAVINIGTLTNWSLLSAGKSIDMPGKKRSIRLALISPHAVPVTVADMQTGHLVCLGSVDGLEEFLFGVDGHVQVSVDTEADVYFRTDDGDVTCLEFDNEPFVEMMERNPRNPQLEYMMYMQEVNANKRAQQMVDAMAAMVARNEENGQANDPGATGSDSGAQSAGTNADAGGAKATAKPAGSGSADGGAERPAGSASADPK